MAKPIKSTPILRGKDAREFERKIAEELKHPVGLVPTPKLEGILDFISKHIEEKYGKKS